MYADVFEQLKSIASKLAPTGDFSVTKNQCGSELAREEALKGTKDHLERNRIPSSNPRNVSGYIRSSTNSRTMLVEAV